MVYARTLPHRPAVALLLGALLVALALLPASPADAAKAPSRLYACVTKNYKTLNLSTRQARCPSGQTKISWRTEGARGARGAQGLQGVAGSVGAEGAVGATGATGATGAKGETGDTGAQGERGEAGSPDTPDDVLAKLLQVDGPGSGLDADLFGGFGVDIFQKRVSGTCATGSAIRSIAADGTTECQSTEVVAPLTLTGDDRADALTLDMPSTSSKRALSIQHDGTGPGIFATSAEGIGIQAVTGSVSAAAVIGDASSGEAIVGRQDGEICEQDADRGYCAGMGAVVGRHDGRGGYGVRGFVTDPNGGIGVLGQAGVNGGSGAGVRGENVNAASDGNAVEGVTVGTGAGVFGQGPTWAGLFSGNVLIDGDLTVTGNLAGFSVDDPRDPTAQTLRHTPVQTDELTVNYTGNVTTDADGLATVQLPDYATELGGDWRYQLTPIGQFGQVIVDREVDADGTFVVRSEHGETKVSWSVTGVRQDPQATSHPFEVEQPKTGALHGRYADPSLHGAPATRSLAPRAQLTTEQPGAASRPKLASER